MKTLDRQLANAAAAELDDQLIEELNEYIMPLYIYYKRYYDLLLECEWFISEYESSDREKGKDILLEVFKDKIELIKNEDYKEK